MVAFTETGRATQAALIEQEIRELSLLIAVNELVPAGMRCDGYVARLKAKLARLQQKPKFKLITNTSA